MAKSIERGGKVYDVIIIGAGINGSFLAHELSKRDCKVLVLDKSGDIADGASMANSAIVHSGHDPKPGTLKCKLNVRGNRMYPDVCKELGVDYKNCSAFVVATDDAESKVIDRLIEQAKDRDIPCIDMSGDKARELEPNLSSNVIRAIELPTTGIIYPWQVAIALMEEAILNGVELKLGEEVTDIKKDGENFKVTTPDGVYESKYVLNVAGVYADHMYELVLGKDPGFHIRARRGEYFVLDEAKKPVVGRVIYPVPGPSGKGVLVVPTVHNNVLLGPNSEPIDDKEGNCTTSEALDYVRANVKKTVDNIPFDKVIRTFAGLRPTGDLGDFVIEESKEVPGFVNVACIESPGLASAPAIAEYVMEEVMADKWNFELKADYERRRPDINVKALSDDEKNALIKEHPEFGEMVCRCCNVSRGEIEDIIRRPAGATTVKGVKKRVRPGMGRCQGGFCEPLVVDILAQELGIPKTEVRYDSRDSVMLMEETKNA